MGSRSAWLFTSVVLLTAVLAALWDRPELEPARPPNRSDSTTPSSKPWGTQRASSIEGTPGGVGVSSQPSRTIPSSTAASPVAATLTRAEIERLVRDLKAHLEAKDFATATKAADVLGKAGADALPFLLEALASSQAPTSRMMLCTLINAVADQPALERLATLLKSDPSVGVRLHLSRIFASRSDDTSRSALAAALASEKDRAVLEELIRAAGFTGSRASVPMLLELLRDGAPSLRKAAASALARLKDEKALSGILYALATASDPDAQAAARVALAGFRFEEAVAPLRSQALSDPDPAVRKMALGALHLLSPTDRSGLEPIFLQAVGDADAAVRREALRNLTWVATPEALAMVERSLLSDADPMVRAQAASTLASAECGGPRSPAAVLSGALQVEQNKGVRLAIVNQFGSVGRTDPQVLTTLTRSALV